MKRYMVVSLLLLFGFSVFSIDQLPEPVLLPRDVYVGDIAELVFFQNFPVPDQVGEDGLSIPGSSFHDSVDYRIDDVRISWQDSIAEIHVRFVSWKTGVIEFTPLETDYGNLIIPPVTIVSIIDRDGISAPSPARSPLLVPGTTWILYGLLLGTFLGAGVVWFLIVKIRFWLVTGPAKRLAARRHRNFLREIRLLSRRSQKSGASWWYGRLSRALKCYMGLYFFSDGGFCLSWTGTEFVQRVHAIGLQEENGAYSGPVAKTLEDLFTAIDRVRFGGSESGINRSGLLESAESFVAGMEEIADHGVS